MQRLTVAGTAAALAVCPVAAALTACTVQRPSPISSARTSGSRSASVVDETDAMQPQRTVVELYGPIPCLDETLEPHDGRIQPVFE